MADPTLPERVAAFLEHHPIGTHSYGHHLVAIIPGEPCEARALVTALIDALDERDALFNLQWTRTREADKLWQAAHPDRGTVWPDLGKLIGWLMRERPAKWADAIRQRTAGLGFDLLTLRTLVDDPDLRDDLPGKRHQMRAALERVAGHLDGIDRVTAEMMAGHGEGG